MSLKYSLKTYVLLGTEAVDVTVELDIGPGLPGFHIIGMADHVVQESRERVRSAIRSCGFQMPQAKMVVNLAPAMLKKSGTSFDLPIALAILCATGQISPRSVEDCIAVGELSLEGEVKSVHGMLAYAIAAQKDGLRLICSPSSDIKACPKEHVLYLSCLADMRSRIPWCEPFAARNSETESFSLDYSEIAGHDCAKRALLIAAVGRHNALMIGPPGSGKTMLAQRFPTILPPLSESEAQEAAVIHSVAGNDIGDILLGKAPIRAPHHSSSAAGLLGGGNPVKPGEASLAHNGVLFLDEMSEFAPRVLQQLRQPMEEGRISIVRAEARISFPSRFMLIGASNPCPCGYLGDDEHECKCTDAQISKYQNRIGGPLLDRMDIVIEVWRSKAKDVLNTGGGLDSCSMREEVMAARERAEFRKHKLADKLSPVSLKGKDAALLYECGLSESTRKLVEKLAQNAQLSGRGIMRTLKLSRSIADLESSDWVSDEHILEAMNYRIRQVG